MDFSKEELARYARHFALPGFGPEAQARLKSARVLVVGAGGLGCPALLYLAAAGVGSLGIVDSDVVEVSNLQRQVLFTCDDVGQPKAEAAKRRLEKLNPFVEIEALVERLTAANAMRILREFDLICDGSDNFPTRYLVNDAAFLLGKPVVSGSVFRFEGQVSVFNFLKKDGSRGPNYRDLFPEPPAPGTVASCEEAGVMGALTGIVGSVQACEAVKVLTGLGEPLAGRLWVFDALNFESRVLRFGSRADGPTISKLIDYEVFCGMKDPVREVSPEEFSQWKKEGRPFQLIDVREPHEFEAANLGGELIPLATVADDLEKIRRDIPVVLHCKGGTRAKRAIRQLEELGFDNLFNLDGGISACSVDLIQT